jgi:hypothetical protein
MRGYMNVKKIWAAFCGESIQGNTEAAVSGNLRPGNTAGSSRNPKPLKIHEICAFETSVADYPLTQSHIPEERNLLLVSTVQRTSRSPLLRSAVQETLILLLLLSTLLDRPAQRLPRGQHVTRDTVLCSSRTHLV